MKRSTSMLLTSALATILLTGQALALTTTLPTIGGQACVGQDFNNAFGALNTSAFTETMVCPTSQDLLVTPDVMTVFAFDRNRFSDVVCSFFGKDANGVIQFSAQQQSSGTNANLFQIGVSTPQSGLVFTTFCSVPAFDSGGPFGGTSGISHIRLHTLH